MREYFKGLAIIYKMAITDYQADQGTKEMIDEFQTEYLQVGWSIISSVNKVLLIAIIIAAYF